MKEKDFADFLREIVRTMEGDEMVEKLDHLVKLQKEMNELMGNQKELPAKLIDEWNGIIRELYPEGRE